MNATVQTIADWFFSRGDNANDTQIADFGSGEELASALTEARKEVTHLQTAHSGELAAEQLKTEAAKTALADAATELAQLKAENAQLKADVEAANNSAEKKANGKLAQMGAKPVDLSQVKDVTDDEAIVAKYNKMPAGPERAAFAKKHARILKA